MAQIILEPGDICEVEDTQDSEWNPMSIDDLTVELVRWAGPMDYWEVRAYLTGKTGRVRSKYLHLKT